jgi:hypothetical protein
MAFASVMAIIFPIALAATPVHPPIRATRWALYCKASTSFVSHELDSNSVFFRPHFLCGISCGTHLDLGERGEPARSGEESIRFRSGMISLVLFYSPFRARAMTDP